MREHLGVLLAIASHWRLTAIYLTVAFAAIVLIELAR